MSLFIEAYKIIQEGKINLDFLKEGKFPSYKVKNYNFDIYMKATNWFSQCGCHVGVCNKPTGLCKHHIAAIVTQFIKENNLKLIEVEKESEEKDSKKD